MNILIVNPNTSAKITSKIYEEAQAYITDDISIKVVHVMEGVDAIESYMEEHLAVNEILKTVENEDFDVLIIGCAGDPGLHVLREHLDVPVLSLMETSMVLSNFHSDRFAIISTGNELDHGVFRRLARLYSCNNRLAKIQPLNCGVLGVDDIEEHLLDTVNNLKTDYGVEAVILGCAAFAGYGKRLSMASGIEVMDGISESIRIAKTMYEGSKIKHGKGVS